MITPDDYIIKAPTLTIYDGLVKAQSVLAAHYNILVSVSGGADSDCMIDIVENLRPHDNAHIVTYTWFDTGVEMDATKRHLTYFVRNTELQLTASVARHRWPVLYAMLVIRFTARCSLNIFIVFKSMDSNGKINHLMFYIKGIQTVRPLYAGGVTTGKTNRISRFSQKSHRQNC